VGATQAAGGPVDERDGGEVDGIPRRRGAGGGRRHLRQSLQGVEASRWRLGADGDAAGAHAQEDSLTRVERVGKAREAQLRRRRREARLGHRPAELAPREGDPELVGLAADRERNPEGRKVVLDEHAGLGEERAGEGSR
jgi:hypothetical protein